MSALLELPILNPRTAKVVCRCLGVTEDEIRDALDTGFVRSLDDLQAHNGAGSGCMCCHRRIKEIFRQADIS